MMSVTMEVSRRGWILGISLTWAELAAAQSGSPPRLEVFDAPTAADIEALTAQIIPSDDGPGAREAGVIYFIDRALTTFEADKRDAYHTGMHEIQQARLKLFPHSTSVAALTPAQQIDLLHAIEKSPFFELLRTHTVWGFVGSPVYGGNRKEVGWTHIGFDDRMHFEPPFGYYDSAARESGKS
jgi:gluconate 2-dehydrogenase gamma chain